MSKPPIWDTAVADSLIGAIVVVGITYADATGDRLEQFWGIIEETDPAKGVALRLRGERDGEVYRLPPYLSAFLPAKPGSYRLRTTGEMVVDPDYTTTWTIRPPGN